MRQGKNQNGGFTGGNITVARDQDLNALDMQCHLMQIALVWKDECVDGGAGSVPCLVIIAPKRASEYLAAFI